MKRGTIIFLNGVSSAGKTSLSNKLKELMEQPLFHMPVDSFWQMLPERYYEGDWAWRQPHVLSMHAAMHQSIATFSDMGLDVVVDHVFELKEWLVDAAERLQGYPVVFVGVHCPLEELERRERERGDRTIGQAKYQLGLVHAHAAYDVEVDTHTEGLEACAERVKPYVESVEAGEVEPVEWRKTRELLEAGAEV